MSSGEARLEIDLAAIRENLSGLTGALAGPDAPEVCAVLKADAYGHGIEHVLPLVADAGIGSIGIASNREAAHVRRLGFTGRVLRVRAAAPVEVHEALALGVEEWVGGFAQAQAIAELGVQEGREIPIHVAVNSLGFSSACIDLSAPGGSSELAAVLALRGLRVRGVCAHFPSEVEADVRAGIPNFARDTARVREALGAERADGVQRHCATSYAALTVPESRFDLVRIGAALYGDTSAVVPWQRSAMRLVAPVAAVCFVPEGRTVGYAGAPPLERDSVIATVPLGYGDGLPRSIGSGRGSVLVRGHAVPIVDRLAMNALAIDVTAVPGVRPGDDVVLYGSQGAQTITSAGMERAAGEIAATTSVLWGRGLERRTVAATPAG